MLKYVKLFMYSIEPNLPSKKNFSFNIEKDVESIYEIESLSSFVLCIVLSFDRVKKGN